MFLPASLEDLRLYRGGIQEKYLPSGMLIWKRAVLPKAVSTSVEPSVTSPRLSSLSFAHRKRTENVARPCYTAAVVWGLKTPRISDCIEH